ncbi:hypothetical protein AB0478_44420 [Streptomyces sp. NPDC051917]|uniref:hypothetical protein n=1 Tax=Streptomyces sp. NPDC051917 TaxID=3154754 RepID=UPI003455FBA1
MGTLAAAAPGAATSQRRTSEQLATPLSVVHTVTKRCRLLTDDGPLSFRQPPASHVRAVRQHVTDAWSGHQLEELGRVRHAARTRLARLGPDRSRPRPAPHPSVQGGGRIVEYAR